MPKRHQIRKPQINVLPTLLFAAGSIVLAALLFWLMLAAAYCVPTDLMAANAEESLGVLEREGQYPVSYSSGKQIDNFTVALMLNEAVSDAGNPLAASLRNERGVDGGDQIQMLSSVVEGSGSESAPYYRYWHGYLVVLKPLLVFIDLYDIRTLSLVCFAVLLAVVAVALPARMGARGYVASLAIVLSYALFGSFDAASTLPMFPSLFISLVGVLLALFIPSPSSGSRMAFALFGMLGAITVYFDFLDNPVLTLGVPLAILVARECGGCCLRSLAASMGGCALAWAVGYGGLWAAKWVLASLVLGEDVVGNALSQASARAGMAEGPEKAVTSPVLAISGNARYAGRLVPLAVGAAAAGWLLVALRSAKGGRQMVGGDLRLGLLLLVVALLPYAWFLALSNHSTIHYWFTYRDQIITLLCALLFLFCQIGKVWQWRRRDRETALRSPAGGSRASSE